MTSSLQTRQPDTTTRQPDTTVRPQPNPTTALPPSDTPAAWLVRLLKGIVIGIGAILPGLSGGVLAVIFRVYDPLIRFLADVRRDFWRNARHFLPIGLGVGAGIVLFSAVVEAAFATHAAHFTVLFIGFVVGTFPSLWAQAGRHGRRGVHLGLMAVAAAGILGLMLLGGQAMTAVAPSTPVWLGSGALIGLGLVVPGMSPSNFLLFFGLYDTMAGGIKRLDPTVVLPLALGLMACVVVFAKVAHWLFQRYHAAMYHLVLGLVVGSSLAIFPTVVFPAFTEEGLAASGMSMLSSTLFALAMLVVGTVGSWLFSLVEDRWSAEREAIEAGG